jgi:hypothetical protein
MNLWIRSQDRLSLKKINYITINGTDIFCEDFLLGTYQTIERTLEVFEAIQEHLEFNIKLKCDTCVYEMPEK